MSVRTEQLFLTDATAAAGYVARLQAEQRGQHTHTLLLMWEISTTHAVHALMPFTGSTFSSPRRQLMVDDLPAPAVQAQQPIVRPVH